MDKFAITYQLDGWPKRRLLGENGQPVGYRELAKRFPTEEAARSVAMLLHPSAIVVELR